MNPIPIVVLLIVVAVETWVILDLTVRRRHPKRKVLVHLHDWTDWSEWVEETLYSDVKVWSRQRACSECNRADRREVGRHNCTAGKGNPCPHHAEFAALMDDKVTRLERDLGISHPKSESLCPSCVGGACAFTPECGSLEGEVR